MNIPSEVYYGLVTQAIHLHGHAQGLEILMDEIQRVPSPASNALCPILESLIARANQLVCALENLELTHPAGACGELEEALRMEGAA